MRAVKILQYGLTIVGAVALGYWLAMFLGSRVYQMQEERNFAREIQQQQQQQQQEQQQQKSVPPGQTPPPVYGVPLSPKNGTVVGRLVIPRVGVSVMVVEGVDDKDLSRAAGHIPGTALPGEPGNVGIAAHRDTFFRPLRSISRNDAITLSTVEGSYRYKVVSTRIVKPKDVQVLAPTADDTLTLVTCYPFSFIGSAPDRFIVKAQRVDVGRTSASVAGR
jgi:sortase A